MTFHVFRHSYSSIYYLLLATNSRAQSHSVSHAKCQVVCHCSVGLDMVMCQCAMYDFDIRYPITTQFDCVGDSAVVVYCKC